MNKVIIQIHAKRPVIIREKPKYLKVYGVITLLNYFHILPIV